MKGSLWEFRRLRESSKGRTAAVAASLALGLFGINIGRQVIPPLLPSIISALAISPAEAGVAMTVMWGLYALIQYPSGRYSDRLSRPVIIIFALGLAIFGAGFLVVSTSYLVFVIGTGLLGLGAGAYLVSMRAYLGDLYDSNLGRAVGINQSIGNLGNTFAAVLAIAVLSVGRWRLAFVLVVPVLLLTLLLINRASTDPFHLELVDLELRDTISRVFMSRYILLLIASYAMVNFTFKGVLSFLPTFLQVTRGFSVPEANVSYASIFIIGILIVPVAGSLGDRFSRLRVVLVSVLVSVVGLAIVVGSSDKLLIGAGVVVFAGGLSGYPAVMQSYLLEMFPPASVGGDFGAVRTAYMLFGSLGPTYVGITADLVSFDIAFGGLVVSLIVCFAIVAYLLAGDKGSQPVEPHRSSG